MSERLFNVSDGDVIDGYKITRANIAHGGVGVVHEALSPDGRKYAIKVLNKPGIIEKRKERLERECVPSLLWDRLANEYYEKIAKAFKEEYQILASLAAHPNVAKVYSLGASNGMLYSVQEFIEGRPLAVFCRDISPLEMLPLFIRALDGLDYIHRSGLVHLDIKSENILVACGDFQKSGDKVRAESHLVKIIDFGIARAQEEYSGEFIGSVPYMAPEVALGRKGDVDGRADLFSFAVLMYHCITCGRYPFSRTSKKDIETIRRLIENERPPSPRTLAYYVKDEILAGVLDKVVFSLLSKNPADRFYGNARAVANALITRMPGAFAGNAETKAAYLIPEGNIHIGREKERGKIFSFIDKILDEPGFQPPVIVVEGGTGLGKSHLLQKIMEKLSDDIEHISLCRLGFPADAATCKHFGDELETALLEDKPIAILLDDVQELAISSDHHRRVCDLVARVMSLVNGKISNPVFREGSNSIFICAAFNNLNSSFDCIIRDLCAPASFTERILLEPLSFLDLYEYLKSTPALKGKQVPGEWMEKIYSRTGGNPLLIREHLEAIDSKSMLFNLEGEIIVDPAIEREFRLPPPGIRMRLEGILERCDPDERSILELGSVWNLERLAPKICYSDILELMPLTYLKQKLENLVSREILTGALDNDTYEFKNGDYFPTLVYEGMSKKNREEWHEKIAAHLKKKVPDDDCVMMHEAYGRKSHAAYRSILKLGRRMLIQMGNVQIARDLFERGMELARGSPNLFACFAANAIDAYQQEGRYQKAEEIYKTAQLEFSGRKNLAWSIALDIKMAAIFLQQHKFDQYDRLSQRIKTDILPGTTTFYLTLLNYDARKYHELSRADANAKVKLLCKAKELFEKTKQLETKIEPHARLNVRNCNLGITLMALGMYDAAIRELGEKLAKHKKEKNLFGILFSSVALADAYRLVRNFGEAETIAEQAVDLAKITNQPKWLVRGYQLLANIHYSQDRYEDALREDDRRMTYSAVLDDKSERLRSLVSIWNHKGQCFKELKRYDMALLNLQAVLESDPPQYFKMSANEGIGEILIDSGKYEEGLRHIEKAELLLEEMPSDTVEETYAFSLLRLRGLALIRMKKYADAERLIKPLAEMSRRHKEWALKFDELLKEYGQGRTLS